MPMFSAESVTDFKKVVYNLLVEHHNGDSNFVYPIQVTLKDGEIKDGFTFNGDEDPEKFLPELYSKHVRKFDLTSEDYTKISIKDLYKYYKRSCMELLSKYFIKLDDSTFIYESTALFVVGSTLRDAELRIARLGTIQRKNRKTLISNASAPRPKRALSEEEKDSSDNCKNTTKSPKKRSKSSPSE